MKAYEQLTRAGKLHRLHTMAVKGLSQFDLKQPTLTYFGFHTNLLYKVKSASGEQFMLRLAYPGWRTYQDLLSEAYWLRALKAETDIPVPSIIPSRTGEMVLQVDFPGIPDCWYMTLMSWVPGKLLGHYLTPSNLEKMGMLFADLHHHGSTWDPPPGFTQKRFEYWLSRGEENLITGEGQNKRLSIPHQGLLRHMDQIVKDAYAKINKSDLRVIHCDLWHDNIKLFRGKLYPLDFEDTIWGYRIHDIAMAMLDLMETVGESRYLVLLESFKRGYKTKMSWPENPIEPFQVGRLLWKINWVAHNDPKYLGKMIERYVPVFEHHIEERKVILPPQ